MFVPVHDKGEKALYAWFMETCAKSISVDGLMFMEKAKWFATALGQGRKCHGRKMGKVAHL